MKRKVILYPLLFLYAISGSAQSEKKDDKDWNVAEPPGEYKDVRIQVSEGTWMNVDVSPDGKEVVFDLLGDIYSMPIAGGRAKVLRSGIPFDVQPRFSPDGSKILFTSDAGGGDNIWVMNKDGANACAITSEDFRLLNNAVWTPDGNYVIARKHFTSRRSAGAGEMWLFHISGGTGQQLTKRKNDQQDVNEPSVSPDGRYLYYSEDMYPGGSFQYNKDPNSQIYVIKRYEFNTGKTATVTGGSGGALRPQISHDGNKLAFVRRIREKSVLFIHNLNTGEEYPIYDGLSKDQQEAWAIFGVYPGFSWMPDDKAIIIWAMGKIRRIDVASGSASEIPFQVDNTLRIADALKFRNEAFTETFHSKAIRHAITSPDGRLLVFNAMGYLWKKTLPDGACERITSGTDFEFEPSFSPRGNAIVYVTWNDEEQGSICTLDLTAKNAKPLKITPEKAIYRTPVFSPDQSQIAFVKEEGNDHQGFTFTKNPGVYLISSNGGTAQRVKEEGEFPAFNKEGNRIFYQTGGYFFGELAKTLKSVKLDGSDERTLVSSKYANRLVPSPDEKWIAFTQLHQAYVAAMPNTGNTIDLDSKSKTFPVSTLSRDAGLSLHWSADSRRVNWTLGDEYYSKALADRFTFLDGSPDSLPPVDTTGIKIGLEVKSDKPSGRIAFTGARIITLEGDEVIEDGVIVIKENKIELIGKAGEVTIPSGTHVVDVRGKTIMPGLVDVHAHLGNFRYGLSPQKQWEYYANLAFGVTTSHDPSSNSEMIFSQSEMIRTGNMIGPRIFSTGIILYGADGDFKAVINSIDDARSALRRTKAFGAFSVKSYNQPRRNQRQQVIQAARELNMLVVPEGGSHFFHNMSMILDGHTGIEHNIPVTSLYDDVAKLWGQSGTGYTPTLIVNYGGINGEYYWYQHTDVWKDERLLSFTPRSILDSRSRHRVMIPDEEYESGYFSVSRDCKKLADAGVKVNLGAHGQLQGLGAHWELWMLVQGGMTPLQALQSATINGAAYIGMDDQIGSLKPGKLADLIVLDENPLVDIQHSRSVKYTMVNGRLFDSATLNEIGNVDRKRSKFYWEQNNYSQFFKWHENTRSFQRAQCSCLGQH